MKVWLLILIFSHDSPTFSGTSGPWTYEQCERGAKAVLHRKRDPAHSAVCVRMNLPEYEVVVIPRRSAK